MFAGWYAHDPITLHFSLFPKSSRDENENSNEPSIKGFSSVKYMQNYDSLACHSNVWLRIYAGYMRENVSKGFSCWINFSRWFLSLSNKFGENKKFRLKIFEEYLLKCLKLFCLDMKFFKVILRNLNTKRIIMYKK